VFLGRCADYILRDFENVVNIFITASIDFRVDIISKVKELDADHARKLIEHVESRRAQYYNYYTGKKWGAAESYDFCIDASILGFEETEKIIATFIRKRFEL
jgi:cytidylate kinase